MGTISAILQSPFDRSSKVRMPLWWVLNSVYKNWVSFSETLASMSWMILAKMLISRGSALPILIDCKNEFTSIFFWSIEIFSLVKIAMPGLLDFICELSSLSISYLERSMPVSLILYFPRNWVKSLMLTEPSFPTCLKRITISSFDISFWMKVIRLKNCSSEIDSGSFPRILLRLMFLE